MQSKNELLQLVKSIANRGKALERDIQKAALGAIYYSVCHGDVTIGQKLLEAFRNGMRKQALIAFLSKYGQFEFSKEKKALIYRKKEEVSITFKQEDGSEVVKQFAELLEDKEYSEQYVEGIKEHWTAAKAEKPEGVVHDLLADIRKVLTKMEKEIKEGNVVNAHVYEAVAEAIAKLEEMEDDAEEEAEQQLQAA